MQNQMILGILQLKMLNSDKLKESENKDKIEEALSEVRRLKTALELRKNTYKIYNTKIPTSPGIVITISVNLINSVTTIKYDICTNV